MFSSSLIHCSVGTKPVADLKLGPLACLNEGIKDSSPGERIEEVGSHQFLQLLFSFS